jgi:eukaryotic-like serine/threonine-protein kinase
VGVTAAARTTGVPLVGRFGPFRLLERVAAAAGANDCFEQHHALWSDARTSGERLCLLRQLPRELTGSSIFARMFAAEAHIMARLAHPNIVRPYASGAIEGVPYVALEYLDGLTLAHVASARRAQRQRLPLEVALYIGHEVAAALAYVHGLLDEMGRPLGLVHGDLRPSHVAVLRTGDIKLTGLGAARVVSFVNRGIAGGGLPRSRPVYLAPEQLAGAPGDARSDLYALGVILWELICSQPLFPTVASTAHSVPVPSRVRADVPPALDGLVLHLLEQAPSRRRKSAEDVRRALAGLIPARADAALALAAMARGGMDARDALPRSAAPSAAAANVASARTADRSAPPARPPTERKRPVTRVVPALTAMLRQHSQQLARALPESVRKITGLSLTLPPRRPTGAQAPALGPLRTPMAPEAAAPLRSPTGSQITVSPANAASALRTPTGPQVTVPPANAAASLRSPTGSQITVSPANAGGALRSPTGPQVTVPPANGGGALRSPTGPQIPLPPTNTGGALRSPTGPQTAVPGGRMPTGQHAVVVNASGKPGAGPAFTETRGIAVHAPRAPSAANRVVVPARSPVAPAAAQHRQPHRLFAGMRLRVPMLAVQAAVVGALAFFAGVLWQTMQVSPALPPQLSPAGTPLVERLNIEPPLDVALPDPEPAPTASTAPPANPVMKRAIKRTIERVRKPSLRDSRRALFRKAKLANKMAGRAHLGRTRSTAH